MTEDKIPNRVTCGICGHDMGISNKEKGELAYCGCENPSYEEEQEYGK